MKDTTSIDMKENKQKKQLIIQGAAISSGYAQGIIHLQPGLLGPIDVPVNGTQLNVEEEFTRLDQATAKISNDLMMLATQVEKEIDTHLAEVFGVHKQILDDHLLKDELRKEIVDNLVTAGSAVKSVFLRWEKRFLLMESRIAREKGDDLRDVSIRLRNALAGIITHPLEKIPENCILVTQRLLPSDTVFLNSRSTAAVLLEYGAKGSHAALFARQLGVPCISEIPKILEKLSNGDTALVDGNLGVLTVNPGCKAITSFQKTVEKDKQIHQAAQKRAICPAVTLDGVRINVNANVGCHEDTSKAYRNGADGIGLYRIEQFYIGRTSPPSSDELLDEMCHTLSSVKGQLVCVRLLDVGADKPLPFVGFMAETNPALGRRGIRFLREYPELLYTQLKAIISLMADYEVQILVPMVTMPVDVLVVKEMLQTVCIEHDVSILPKLGAMIETPAAALSASTIAPHVDFMSFGSNDLTQYAFAADRENASVESYYNDDADVIFRMMELVHNDVPDMPLSICGELAGCKEHIRRLLLCGITSLSVAAPLVPIIKETVRKTKIT
ncbi:phosphoenolpyruvate--protein phosphotransferase [Zooshikella ganghwensis]|uniref:phosphoenolpyruvate--protein phosphotransferase n=1 Tax=Zooshikella ganghwensis TaxID=202772 RepID=UPI0003FF11EB|nr:phosphoenolpyruvate--protein phosphotransferase [Zooshikella ganghwensis]